jgi:hypothetical protein
LAPGTYLIIFSGYFQAGGSNGVAMAAEAAVSVGTASATIVGTINSVWRPGIASTNGPTEPFSNTVIATVTVAGTIILTGYYLDTIADGAIEAGCVIVKCV